MTKFDLDVLNEKHPFNVGLGFLGHFQDVNKFSFNELVYNLESNPFKYLPELMYQSMKYAIERKGGDCSILYDVFLDWIDDNGGASNKSLKKFSSLLIESLNSSLETEEDNDKEDSKKK